MTIKSIQFPDDTPLSRAGFVYEVEVCPQAEVFPLIVFLSVCNFLSHL